MKTSLAGIACFAWFIILNLSQRGDAQFVDESCKTYPPTQPGAWMVILRNKTDFRCAGSLINKQFVLTVAECIEGQGSLTALLGAIDPEDPILRVPVKQIHTHRSYSRESGLNNIGLVMLSRSVQYTDQVRPICILRTTTALNTLEQIKSFKTFGWGIGTNGIISYNRANITIRHDESIYCDIEPDQPYFCGGPSLEGSCGGDFGGPLSSYVKLRDPQVYAVQFGIASMGREKCRGARPYIDVTKYADWIERTVQDPKIQQPETPVTEDSQLYSRCGEVYLTANIFGPDFMAKGVMITHRFVLTTATKLTDDVSYLRVGVQGLKDYEELAIDSVYKHPDGPNTDLALLKLESELIPEDVMKPICILRRSPLEQSLPKLTILDIDRKQPRTIFKVARTIENVDCSAFAFNPSEICVQTPAGIKQVFGIRGNVVSQKITIPENNTTIHPLFGIVKYSEGGKNVIIDVTSHTNWIASILKDNSV